VTRFSNCPTSFNFPFDRPEFFSREKKSPFSFGLNFLLRTPGLFGVVRESLPPDPRSWCSAFLCLSYLPKYLSYKDDAARFFSLQVFWFLFSMIDDSMSDSWART